MIGFFMKCNTGLKRVNRNWYYKELKLTQIKWIEFYSATTTTISIKYKYKYYLLLKHIKG